MNYKTKTLMRELLFKPKVMVGIDRLGSVPEKITNEYFSVLKSMSSNQNETGTVESEPSKEVVLSENLENETTDPGEYWKDYNEFLVNLA